MTTTLLADHALVEPVRAVFDQLKAARYRVSGVKPRTGMTRVDLAADKRSSVAAQVWIDTDDGQLLEVVLPGGRGVKPREASGAEASLELLATLLPESAPTPAAQPVEPEPAANAAEPEPEPEPKAEAEASAEPKPVKKPARTARRSKAAPSTKTN